jgi:hypothetical protein
MGSEKPSPRRGRGQGEGNFAGSNHTLKLAHPGLRSGGSAGVPAGGSGTTGTEAGPRFLVGQASCLSLNDGQDARPTEDCLGRILFQHHAT